MKKSLSIALSLVMIIATLTALPFSAHAKVITGGAGPSAEFIFDTSTGEMLFRGLPTGIEGEYAEGTIDGIYDDTTDDFDQDAYDEAIGIGITSMVFDKSISGIEIIWPFQGNPCVETIELNGQDIPARCFEGYTALTDVDISTSDYIGECAFAYRSAETLRTSALTLSATIIQGTFIRMCSLRTMISKSFQPATRRQSRTIFRDIPKSSGKRCTIIRQTVRLPKRLQ